MRGRKDMPPGPGRPPGCRNKITRTMKESFLNVYDALGGEEWLLTVAKENELEFAKLLARLLPSSVHAEVANITEQPEDSLSDAELERIAAGCHCLPDSPDLEGDSDNFSDAELERIAGSGEEWPEGKDE